MKQRARIRVLEDGRACGDWCTCCGSPTYLIGRERGSRCGRGCCSVEDLGYI